MTGNQGDEKAAAQDTLSRQAVLSATEASNSQVALDNTALANFVHARTISVFLWRAMFQHLFDTAALGGILLFLFALTIRASGLI